MTPFEQLALARAAERSRDLLRHPNLSTAEATAVYALIDPVGAAALAEAEDTSPEVTA